MGQLGLCNGNTNSFADAMCWDDTNSRSTPVKFNLPAGLTAVSFSVDNVNHTTYVIASDGNVYGAGANDVGQLGPGCPRTGTGAYCAAPVKLSIPIPYDFPDPYVF
jgi:hypothetical protein